MIGKEEGTSDTSTLNPAPLGPPKNPSRNGYTPSTRRFNPKTHTPEGEPEVYLLRSPTFMPEDPNFEDSRGGVSCRKAIRDRRLLISQDADPAV